MKKIYLILTVFVFFLGLGKINAEEVDWSSITSRYKELINDSNYQMTMDDKTLQISLTNSKYGDYQIKFNYDADSNQIVYNSERDLTSANDDLKMYYALSDTLFSQTIIFTLMDLYGIDSDKLSEFIGEEEDLSKLGININTGEHITISNDSSKIYADYIDSINIDLNEFNTATKDIQNTLKEQDTYITVISFIKTFVDPLSENLGLYIDITDALNKIDDNIETTEKTTDKNNSAVSSVKVESTGLNKSSLILIVGFIFIVIGAITFKRLFSKSR